MSASGRDAEDPAVSRFRLLYESYYPDILAYASRRVPERSEAGDIVSDVFLVAWRRLEDVPEGDEALLWLYGVARRVLANHSRGRERRLRLVRRFEQLPRLNPDLESALATHSEIRELVSALTQLSEEDRELLLLAAWEQLTVKEIATVVGCSENAASIRLHRARKRLTNVYKKENGSSGQGPHDWPRTRRSADRGGDPE